MRNSPGAPHSTERCKVTKKNASMQTNTRFLKRKKLMLKSHTLIPTLSPLADDRPFPSGNGKIQDSIVK